MEYANKKVLLIGLGSQGGGIATARWLVRQHAKLTVIDQKDKVLLKDSLRQLRGLPIKYLFGKQNTKLVNDFSMIVQNPAVPNNHPLILAADKLKIPIENEASLFFKNCHQPIIGVTGSKGKSTTSSLLGYIFKLFKSQTVVAGNIRDKVMLDVLPKLTKKSPVILELSSWHLEIMGRWHLSPEISIVTNLLPDHLNRYRGLTDYAKAKANIFKWQKNNHSVILNYDNVWTRKMSHSVSSKIYWFSTKKVLLQGAFIKSGVIYFADHGQVTPILRQAKVKLLGKHNVYNILAAVCAAKISDVPLKYIQKGVSTFPGLHSRLQLIRKINNILFYNDTAATAPDATIAAINSFPAKKIVLIAGGTDKKLPYRELARGIKSKVESLVLLPGTATDKLRVYLGKNYLAHNTSSMSEAVRLAYKLAEPGCIVLMSPGAASFGLFMNEWDRGEQFIKAVRKLS